MRRIILCGSIAAVGVYGFMTGGLAIVKQDYFLTNRVMVFPGSLSSSVYIAPRFTQCSLPFLFHYCGGGKPFGLHVELWGYAKRYRSFEITAIIVDGREIRHDPPWISEFKPHTDYNWTSTGLKGTHLLMLRGEIENLPVMHQDTKITLKGELINANGERLPVVFSESFTPKSIFKLTIFWDVMAGV
jgi:hypothetical protein